MLLEKLTGKNKQEIKVFKSTIWYLICSFITSGISFLTAPIFARILPQDVYGEYSNFLSWYNIILCFTTLNLHASVMRAKYDFPDEFPTYVSSILALGTVNALVCYLGVMVLFPYFRDLTNLDRCYTGIIFITQMVYPAGIIFQVIQRINYKYKLNVFITLATSILTSACSMTMVLVFKDKMFGRVVGSQIPALLINIILYVYLIIKGKGIRIYFWKYAYLMCLPYIPHLLAGNLLGTLDRVMITNICGAEQNAIYSVAGNVVLILNIFSTSVNYAVQPWIFEKFQQDNQAETRRLIGRIWWLYTIIAIFIIIFSNEAVYVLGGEKYTSAGIIIPPLVLGSLFQFMYTFYVSAEQYKKKTGGMAIATMVAAMINYILNAILIPYFGYVAAAYTTAVSYGVLLMIHFFLVRRLKFTKYYYTHLLFLLPSVLILTNSFTSDMRGGLKWLCIFVILMILAGILLYKICKSKTNPDNSRKE